MKRIAAALALAALLAAPAPAPAQDAKPAPAAEEKSATLDERYYRAFYLENGLRDFEKANKAYADLTAAAAQEGKRDLQVKCLLGRVRCLRTMQKAEEAGKLTATILHIDPDNAEAKALAAGTGSGDGKVEDLDKRIQTLVTWLEAGSTTPSIYELRIIGDRAVPFLARSLRRRDLTAVINAATFLSYNSTAASRAALLEALRDPETVYAVTIAESICKPSLGIDVRAFEDEDLPLLEEIAKRPEVDLRLKVLFRLDNDSGNPETITDLVVRLAGDSDPRVRMQTLRAEWGTPILRSLLPAIRGALASRVPEERAAAAVAAGRDADLLRGLQGEVRSLLKDESPTVRWEALRALGNRDGLTQDDLAGLLEDPDGALIGAAAERLKIAAPWGDAAAAAVRRAMQKAMKAEIPAHGIEKVVDLVDVTARPGGFTPEEWIDLLGATWGPRFPWGSQATWSFRQRILNQFEAMVRDRGYQPEMDGWVLRGVEGIPSADGVVHWLEFWNGRTGTGARAAWLRAASSPDGRVRALAYGGIVNAHHERGLDGQPRPVAPALSRPFAVVFPYMAGDLAAADPGFRSRALGAANLFPDPSLAAILRTLHDRAARYERARLLEILVRAAGKEALGAVRADLASKDPQVRSEALGRLVVSLGVEDLAEIQSYLSGGGQPNEVLALWYNWDPPPSVDLLRAFLKTLPEERFDGTAMGLLDRLPQDEMWSYVYRGFKSPLAQVRVMAADKAGEGRRVDWIASLSAMLDDPDVNVREATKNALEELRTYIDLKASAARIGKGGEANTFQFAEHLLKSDQPLKRKGAVLALAALGDKAAIPILLKALDDPDPSVQEAALGALERLGGKPPAGAEKKD